MIVLKTKSRRVILQRAIIKMYKNEARTTVTFLHVTAKTEKSYELILRYVVILWTYEFNKDSTEIDDKTAIRHRDKCIVVLESWAPTVYVCHLTEWTKKRSQVLNLVQFITSFGVHCIVDLLCQVNINKMGGLANWLPNQIRDANKILVVFSKAYLKALNSSEDPYDAEVCKVHAEFHHIKSIMYHSLQRVQIIIVLDGVRCEEMPAEFQDQFYCKFPKILSIENTTCCRLIGLLLDEEPFVIDIKKSPVDRESLAVAFKESPFRINNVHHHKPSFSSPTMFPLLSDR